MSKARRSGQKLHSFYNFLHVISQVPKQFRSSECKMGSVLNLTLNSTYNEECIIDFGHYVNALEFNSARPIVHG